MRPLTHSGPKQLIPIANKPVLHYCVEDLANAGIKEIGVIVGYDEERISAIKNALGDGSEWGVKITYIEQDAPRGLAHAVGIAEEFLGGEPFVVYLGDNLVKGGIAHFISKFDKNKCTASLLLAQHSMPHKFGVAVLENGKLVDVEEKPENPKSNLVIAGVYIFTRCIFEAIKQITPGKHGELQLTDAIKILMQSPERSVSTEVVSGWWDDMGTSEDILRANRMILLDIKSDIRGSVSKNVSVIGNVQIGEGTVIEENCVIKGPVVIGKNCRIGPDAYIGPYTSIGDNTTMRSGEIEDSIIIGDCTLNFREKIVNSLIGRNSCITSNGNKLPKGHKFILGEFSNIET